jgi:hypothetical protein
MYFTTQYQLQPIDFISELFGHITHVSAICHNVPINNFMTDRKKLNQTSTYQQLGMLRFYKNMWISNF